MTFEQFVHAGKHSREEIFELMKALADLIVEGTYINLSPEYIEIRENCTVSIRTDSKSENAFFMAPEQIFRGKKADRETALFSFGMLFYYIANGQNWYIANSINVYETLTKGTEIWIASGHYAKMNHLVSRNPEEREVGYDAFLRLYQSFPKGTILIEYKTEDSTVLTEEIQIREDVPEYAKGKKIKGTDRNIYIAEMGASLSPRLTEQHVTIPVVLFKEAEDVIRGICYQSEYKGSRSGVIKAVEYDGLDCQFDVPVDTARKDKIVFLMTCTKALAPGNENDDKNKKDCAIKKIGQVPLSSRWGKAVLHVTVLADQSSLVVSLYDQNKTKRIVDRDLSFHI